MSDYLARQRDDGDLDMLVHRETMVEHAIDELGGVTPGVYQVKVPADRIDGSEEDKFISLHVLEDDLQ